MSVNVRLDGMDQLERQLEKLDFQMRVQTMDRALRAAANVVRRRAKQLVPVLSGGLRRSISVKRVDYAGGAFVAIVGPKGGLSGGPHGHLVERGHEIVLHDGTRTGVMTEGQPFMRPAAEQTRDEQMRAFNEVIRAAVESVK